MKQISLILLVTSCAIAGFAKSSFVPDNYSLIILEEASDTITEKGKTNEIFAAPIDNRFSVAVLHDSINKDRIKSIKKAEAAHGLAVFATILGAASSIMSASLTPLTPVDALWQSTSFVAGLNISGSSAYLAYVNRQKVDNLHKLPITILFSNNTNKEMCVNDLNRGLFWYVRPYGILSLNAGNPEINSFRIAYADYNSPQICYATIQAANLLEDAIIKFEDDEYWVYEYISDPSSTTSSGLYVIKNKQTYQKKIVKEKECKEFVNGRKNK